MSIENHLIFHICSNQLLFPCKKEKMGRHKMWQPIFSLYILWDQIVPVTVKVPVPGVTIQLPVAGSCV